MTYGKATNPRKGKIGSSFGISSWSDAFLSMVFNQLNTLVSPLSGSLSYETMMINKDEAVIGSLYPIIENVSACGAAPVSVRYGWR
jgi:hypothetical protein